MKHKLFNLIAFVFVASTHSLTLATEYLYQLESSDQRDTVNLTVSDLSRKQTQLALQIGGESVAMPADLLSNFPNIQAASFRVFNQFTPSPLGKTEQLVSLTFDYEAPEGAKTGAIYFRDRRYFLALQTN